MSFFPLMGDYGINDTEPLVRAPRTSAYPPITMFVHEIEFSAGTRGTGIVTEYFSTKAMVTGGYDTPPDTTFQEVIDDPGTVKTQIFGSGRQLGFVAPSWGNITYKNTSGEFDAWIDYSTDGAKVTCRFGNYGDAYPDEFTICYVAYIDGKPSGDYNNITFSLRGRERIFEERVTNRTFDGNDPTSVSGIDLNGTGIARGRNKPMVMGAPGPVAPIILDETENLWFVYDAPPERIIPTPP